MRYRTGTSLSYYIGLAIVIVATLIVTGFLFIEFVKTLDTTSRDTSEEAYRAFVAVEETLTADCATSHRSMFNQSAIEDGDLDCLGTDEQRWVIFSWNDGGNEVKYAYDIAPARPPDVSSITVPSIAEVLAEMLGDYRTFPIVIYDEENDVNRRGILVIVTGDALGVFS